MAGRDRGISRDDSAVLRSSSNTSVSGSLQHASTARNFSVMPASGSQSASMISDLQQMFSAIQDLATKPKLALFRLVSLLGDESIGKEFLAQKGLEPLVATLKTSTGNTLAYSLQALRALCKSAEGLAAVVEVEDIRKKAFAILETADYQMQSNVTKQALDLLFVMVRDSTNKGYSKVDSTAVSLAEEKKQNPYDVLPRLLKMHTDLDVRTNTLKLINHIIISSSDTPAAAERVHLFQTYGVSEMAHMLKLDYAPFKEQLQTFDQVIQSESQPRMLVQGVKQASQRELVELRSRLKDISELCSNLQKDNKRLTSELKIFKRREPLVQLLWDEVQTLRSHIAAAQEQGFAVNPDAPQHRIASSNYGDGITNVSGFDPSGGARGYAAGPQNTGPPAGGQSHSGSAPSKPVMQRPHTVDSTTHSSSVPPAPGVPTAPGIPAAPGIPSAPAGPAAPKLPTAIEPTKAKITPLVKMKPLHWSRVILPRKMSVETVWSLVDEANVPTDELMKLYCAKTVLKKTKGAGADKDEAKTQGAQILLDPKRHQQIAISLTKLPELTDLIQAIRQMDEAVLPLDGLDRLVPIMPTEEETKVVLDSNLPEAQLGEPERFVKLVSTIPQAANRVSCWAFKNHFPTKREEVEKPLHLVFAACKALETSKRLREMLSVVLTIGNYMNGGNSNRGQADGFNLTVLGQLGGIKDTETGTQSLLEYVGEVCARLYGNDFASQVWDELKDVDTASRTGLTLRQAVSGAREFLSRVTTHRGEVSLVAVAVSDSTDPFNATMKSFQSKADAETKGLQALIQQTQEKFIKTVRFFDPRKSPMAAQSVDSGELFGPILGFVQQIKFLADRKNQRDEEKAFRERRAKLNEQMKMKLAKTLAKKE